MKHTKSDSKTANQYRLMHLDTVFINLIISKLANSPTSSAEASYNAVLVNRYADVFEKLKGLEPCSMAALVKACRESVTVTVNMLSLRQQLEALKLAEQRYSDQLKQTKWLVLNKASNQQILEICSSVSAEELKKIRAEMGFPVTKGRKKMPCDDIRLEIASKWWELGNLCLFERYEAILEHFPEYELGQLYTIVNDKRWTIDQD